MLPWLKNRKLRKLVRNPDLFFYDMFRKRLIGQHCPLDTIGLDEPLPRDAITSLEDKYEQLVGVLADSTVVAQAIAVEHPNIRRLAIKSRDVKYGLEQILAADFGGYSAVVRVWTDPARLYEVTFTDGRFEYRNPTIQIDPWSVSGGNVLSRNRNKYNSTVPTRDIQKTMCSPAPLGLAGEPPSLETLHEVMGVESSFLRSFDQPIDVVYTWVDDEDPAWKAKKKAYLDERGVKATEDAVGAARFRNRGELRYSLRSLASFLPEARNIFLVTDSQVPAWLDTAHPRITVVSHEQIFQNAEHLPTFNSHAIEANLHRIDGLSEHFLYFNDDVLLLNPCLALDFFHPNGISKSFFEPVGNVSGTPGPEHPAFKNAALRGAKLLQQRFGKTPHTYLDHVVHALRKSVIEDMWREFPDALITTSAARLRGDDDISPLSFFYHYYALSTGRAVPGEIRSAYVPLRGNCAAKLDALRSDVDTKVVCINDLPATTDEDGAAAIEFLDFMWPVAVDWELDK